MAGDPITAIATLLNTVLTWVFDPAGYAKLTREAKIEKLMDALQVALDARALDAVDLIFVELRKLSAQTGP
jgi:hypothetical protein